MSTQPIIDQLLAALASNAKREGADENPIPLQPSQSVTLQHVYNLFYVSFIFQNFTIICRKSVSFYNGDKSAESPAVFGVWFVQAYLKPRNRAKNSCIYDHADDFHAKLGKQLHGPTKCHLQENC